jgi:hypothetical protein
MNYATPGSRCPVFVAGIKYPSIAMAATECEISQRWLHVIVKKNNGAPAVVKNQFIVTDFWVRERMQGRTA